MSKSKKLEFFGDGIIIVVSKADPIRDDKVQSTILKIVDTLPSLENRSMVNMEDFYHTEAQNIMTALSNLPQGTKHQLLILLLDQMTNIYRGK